jgi:choline-sulfatase
MRRVLTVPGLCLCALLGARLFGAGVGVGVAAAARKPNVVLITLDTTRADRMGFLGSIRGLTPALDALAKTGVVFERAYSQAPITTVSHATILSGTYPQFHGVNDFGVPLPVDLPYVPALLKAQGYRTGAFVGALILDARNGLAPGFDRGFDTYDAGYQVRRGGGRSDRYETLERRGAQVVARAQKWLDTDAAGTAPFFLWVHLYDAHDPYDPPAPFKARFAKAPYDGEIAAADSAVGQLLAALKAKGRFDDTLVVVAADHGESLGEHGESTHGVFLYDATIHVPLVVKFPRGQGPGAGKRVAARVGLVDLAPTILQAVGVAVPAQVQGVALAAAQAAAPGTRNDDRAIYSETDYPNRAFGWSSLAAYRVDQFLYVNAPRPELFALDKDPQANSNVASERAAVAARIGQALDDFRRRTAAGGGAATTQAKVDPELAERLAALGYVSGGGAPAAASAGAIDPKDRIATSNTLHTAMLAIENGDNLKAIPLLEQVVAQDPQVYMAQLQLGIARSRERRYSAAVPALHKAIEIRPDSPLVHYEMGLALFETGDLRKAAGHFEIAATRQPKWADARFSLGSVYARTDRVPAALAELRAALEQEPEHYRANLLYGRILSLQGQVAESLPHLEKAAGNAAASAEAHLFLAEAYTKAGRAQDAARERARAASAPRPGRNPQD